MGFSLFPKTVKFEKLFFDQIAQVVASARLLEEMCYQSSGFKERCLKINHLEEKGSAISREISRQLNLTFITPIDREDIHEINKVTDKVLDVFKQIAARLGARSDIAIPQAARKISTNLRIMVEEAEKMLAKLGTKDKEVQEHLGLIKQAKEASDLVLVEALTEMYKPREVSNEGLLTTIRWSRIYDRLERAVCRADHLAEVIEGVILKNA
jgi:uncharacterized protein Yka (UPF0111/DUF47 family)